MKILDFFTHPLIVEERETGLLIKGRDRQWLNHEVSIRHEAFLYFNDLFQNKPVMNSGELAYVIPNVVSEQMNQDLCKIVREEEVRYVVFGLGALKAPRPYGF